MCHGGRFIQIVSCEQRCTSHALQMLLVQVLFAMQPLGQPAQEAPGPRVKGRHAATTALQ